MILPHENNKFLAVYISHTSNVVHLVRLNGEGYAEVVTLCGRTFHIPVQQGIFLQGLNGCKRCAKIAGLDAE